MNRLREEKIDREKSFMLLQIHDELIFEAGVEIADTFAKEAQQIMEEIYPLRVPLECSVAVGDNWGELK
jgi:DNA polymerase-1